MLNLGVLKLNETEQTKNYYVGVWDTEVVVTRDPRSLKAFNQKGKIKVIYDGLFFGSLDDRKRWVEDMIISHLMEKGYLVKTGETITGDPVWQLRKEGKTRVQK